MIKWRDEFLNIMNYQSVKEYVESRKKMKVDIQNIKYRYYLASNISLQKVLQIDKLILYKAEDGAFKITQKWISLIGLFEANKHRMYTLF